MTSEGEVLERVDRGLFIDGTWREQGANTIVVEDPATEAPLLEIADATVDDGVAALDAASAAQEEWAATSPRMRSELLRSAFELLTARADEFAMLITLEMGKPLDQARGEVAYGAEFFRWFSEEAVRVAGRFADSPDGRTRLVTMKHPVGPALLITPWNFPLAMGTRKIGPAIAAGCTMVVKPARQTPLTMLALAGLLEEVGLPRGVLNLVTTTRTKDLVGTLMSDRRLRKVSFTGSTEVGKGLVRQSADNLLRVSMELGGNAPFLVFADADLDAAVDGAMLAKMRNMGEACTAANRFLVEESVADEFAVKFAARMEVETVGRGTEDGVTVGPMIDGVQLGKVADLVEDATTRGAAVVTGGKRIDGPGHFYRPTVLTGVSADANLFREEIFGPVAPIATFSATDEAVALANDSDYGLASYVYTSDANCLLAVCERLEAGMVGANQGLISNPAAPFGGMKHSGFGREGGPEGIDEYLDLKYVGIA